MSRRSFAAAFVTSTLVVLGVFGPAAAQAEPTPAPSSPSSSVALPATTTPATPALSPDGSAPAASEQPGSGSRAIAQAVAPGPACATNSAAITPVVCLPAGSGEDQVGLVVLGGEVFFFAQIVNNGVDVADAEVVFTLPPELRQAPDKPAQRVDRWYETGPFPEPTDLPCTRSGDGATLTCRTGALPSGTNTLIAIALRVTPAAQIGAQVTFTTTLQPVGAGIFPTTSVETTVEFIEPTELTVSITPGKAEVILGQKKRLLVSVRNVGTSPAPDTFAVTALVSDLGVDGDFGPPHFTITNAPDLAPPDDIAIAGSRLPAREGAAVSLYQARPRGEVARSHAESPVALWPVGTIAPGATAQFTVEVRAQTEGADDLLVATLSAASDPSCEGEGGDEPPPDDPGTDEGCGGFALASLTAIAAPVPQPSSHAPADKGDAVANTGAGDLTPQVLLGLLSLLVGIGLTAAGRTRYRGRHEVAD